MIHIGHALAASAMLLSAQSIAGHFDGWRQSGSGADGGVWYLYSDSAKTIHHVKTGKAVGKYVWAGWARAAG